MVVPWLRLNGVPEDEIKLEYDWPSFETTVGKAEEFLRAKFRWSVNHRYGDQVTLRVRSDLYSYNGQFCLLRGLEEGAGWDPSTPIILG